MTLCGVLKDILLVGASIIVWSTIVSPLQYFGYAIALGGLVYYKLGGEKIKSIFSDMGRSWAEYGARHPALRKIIVFGTIVIFLLTVVGGAAPSLGYDRPF